MHVLSVALPLHCTLSDANTGVHADAVGHASMLARDGCAWRAHVNGRMQEMARGNTLVGKLRSALKDIGVPRATSMLIRPDFYTDLL